MNMRNLALLGVVLFLLIALVTVMVDLSWNGRGQGNFLFGLHASGGQQGRVQNVISAATR